MEQLKKFNLEVALFAKEVKAYIENVNEIDNETITLLIETIISVNKLQTNSKFHETSLTNESDFVNNLNNEIFDCRRYIVCCICHEQIPLSPEDFNIHINKRSHKNKEAELQSPRPNGHSHINLERTTSLINDTSSVEGDQHNNQKSNSSDSSVSHNGNTQISRASSLKNLSNLPAALKMKNAIDFQEVCRAIKLSPKNDYTFRTAERIAHETQIVEHLMHHMNAFDSALELMPFGSSTYGFGGSNTNFNILVRTGESNQEPIVAFCTFEKYLKAVAAVPSRVQPKFKVLSSISASRVQNRRLQVIHIASGILCWIQFQSNFELAESSQTVRDCIMHSPICYHLIAYVQYWQNALNGTLVQKGLRAFQFNTYIISVFVIFFLQLDQEFPKVANVPPSHSRCIDHVPDVDKEKLQQAVAQFFNFYGDKFQMNRQIISVNIGRWQDRFLQSQQTNFTLEQKRLRDGIKSKHYNWENCTMYVQDLISPDTNITAEISEEAANNFKQLCQMFASDDSCTQSIDEYLIQIEQVRSAITSGSAMNPNSRHSAKKSAYELSDASLNALQNLKYSIANMPNISATSSISDDKSRASSVSISPRPATLQKLKTVFKIEHVLRAIPIKAVGLINRMVDRCFHEMEVVALLTRYLKTFDPRLKVMPFGSATYGLGGSTTNLNILVNAGDSEQKPFVALQTFQKLLNQTTDIQNDFTVLSMITGDRVQKRRLQVIHNASSILCWIQFDTTFELAESSQIVRNYIQYDPICYHLIVYVRAWQNSLNEIAAQNGLCAFRLNTYIISILVIFFLQLKQEYPQPTDLPSSQIIFIDYVPKIDKERLKQVSGQFFDFYGNYFEMNRKVISVGVGRWQNRELDSNQTNFTPEQKRLRDGIESNTLNWENCTMYVQDLQSSAKNATAEISEQEANNFKDMCKAFNSATLHNRTIDEYLLKLSQARTVGSASSVNCICSGKKSIFELSESSSSLLERFNDVNPNLEEQIKSEVDSFDSNTKISSNASAIGSEAPSTSNSVKKLEDTINVDEVLKFSKIEMNRILTRTKSRIQNEQKIIELLSFLLTTYDSTISISPFGSATYGFGGERNNFNILIIKGMSSTSHLLQTSFENSLTKTDLQHDFKFVCKVKPNRVQSEQLKILHIKSGIECVLQFTTKDAQLCYSKQAKTILDYMSLHPMCKRLIAYVKAWQNVLNDQASKSGLVAFNMNTYIIAVLVIFYLQVNHELPTIDGLISAIAKGLKFSPKKSSLEQFIKEFFDFYAKTFESKSHLISANVGRWQQKKQIGQKHFTPEQKSMREGIKACPKNWENCTMCVQDLISLRTNITAEIIKQEVDNFVRMCQIFTKHLPKFDDECSKSPASSSVNNMDLSLSGERTLNSNQHMILINLIDKEIKNSRSPAVVEVRQRAELEITSTMAKFIREFNPSLKLYPFGSTQYGIRFANTNFNLLIVNDTSSQAPSEICQRFFLKCKSSGICKHFKDLCEIKKDRVMDKQISMIHVKTGIQCLILFQNNSKITDSIEIIKRFAIDPLFNYLVTFIRMWQTILNQSNIARFEFNTYTIAILVLFFLQVNHNFPKVDETTINVCSSVSNFKNALKELFNFYGNRYQIWNHVICTQIGRWQERRIQPSQTSFTPAQKRLRTGIGNSSENWKNCSMFVQDLVRPNVNVTAEISQKAAQNFQEMCQIFAKKLK